MSMDTVQQAAALHQSKVARKVRARFPQGQRVHYRVYDKYGRGEVVALSVIGGTVYRHVPGLNAQGGHLVVDWDNGTRGTESATNLEATSL